MADLTPRAAPPRAIVALDVPGAVAARAIVDRLGDACDFYKVGSQLFTAAGPEIVRALVDSGKDVFLDLKFHDIPNTVLGAARSAAGLGARLITVHASGGLPMVRAAVEGAGDACGVLAVTVLTSLDAPTLGAAWGRPDLDLPTEVARLATVAADAGAHGVVSAGGEVALLRKRGLTTLRFLVPGIRLPGAAADDQARTMTPGDAVRAGADYLVLGRTVTAATDPVAALQAALHDMRT